MRIGRRQGLDRPRCGSSESGAAAVELALTLPILLLLIFGIIEFGIVFNRYNSVNHAAREGVRQMSVGAVSADAETSAENAAPDLNAAGNVSCTGVEVAPRDVQMTCTTNYNLSLWVISETITMSSTATMRQE